VRPLTLGWYGVQQNRTTRAHGEPMIDDMGIFRTDIQIASIFDPLKRLDLSEVMVDTGSAYNWIPRAVLEGLGVQREWNQRFETASGDILERPVGFAMIFAAGRSAPTIVAFAEPGDMILLGAIGLEGLNLRVDLNRRELVPGGPLPVAAAA